MQDPITPILDRRCPASSSGPARSRQSRSAADPADLSTGSRRYPSGIYALWSSNADIEQFARELGRVVRTMDDDAFAFVYYSSAAVSPDALVAAIDSEAGSLRYCGCASSGEISPLGMQSRGVVAVLLPSRWFRVAVTTIERIDALGMNDIAEKARLLGQEFDAAGGKSFAEMHCTQRVVNETDMLANDPFAERDDVFAVSLVDGLTYAEESVTAALNRGLINIPLIGGSSGDDLAFEHTTQICNGAVHSRAAVLALIECRLPYLLFSDNNFEPTAHKLVVTASDLDRRRVFEFNAEPAALAYAKAIGVPVDALQSRHFASYPMVVRVGGEYYSRAIQRLNDDLSLSFFCAIDNGLVLTVARSHGLLDSITELMRRLDQSLGGIELVFGFDCIHRRLDAEHRNLFERVSSLYTDNRFIGFSTYGEQFQAMHLNQTVTGVAFGSPPADH